MSDGVGEGGHLPEVADETVALVEWLERNEAWDEKEIWRLLEETGDINIAVKTHYDRVFLKKSMRGVRRGEKLFEEENGLTVTIEEDPDRIEPYAITPRFVLEPIMLYARWSVPVTKQGKTVMEHDYGFKKGYMVWNDGVEVVYKRYPQRPEITIKGDTYVMKDEPGDPIGDDFLPGIDVLNMLRLEPVLDGKQIYQDVKNYIKTYWHTHDPRIYSLLTAWTMGTFFHNVWGAFPYLHFHGRAETGKTRAIRVLAALGFHGLFDKSGTVSTAFHSVSQYGNTHCIDELEKVADKPDFLGYLLNGYSHGGKYRRRGGVNFSRTETFFCYSPKCFASINPIPSVLMTRTVQVRCFRPPQDMPTFYREAEAEAKHLSNQLHLLRMLEGNKVLAHECSIDACHRNREVLEPLVHIAEMYCPEDVPLIRGFVEAYFGTELQAAIEGGDFTYRLWEFITQFLLDCGYDGKGDVWINPEALRFYIYMTGADDAITEEAYGENIRQRLNNASPLVKEFTATSIGSALTAHRDRKSPKALSYPGFEIPIHKVPTGGAARCYRFNGKDIAQVMNFNPFVDGQQNLLSADSVPDTNLTLLDEPDTITEGSQPDNLTLDTVPDTVLDTTTTTTTGTTTVRQQVSGSVRFSGGNGENLSEGPSVREKAENGGSKGVYVENLTPDTSTPDKKSYDDKEVAEGIIRCTTSEALSATEIRFALRDDGLSVGKEQVERLVTRMMNENVLNWVDGKYKVM